MAQEVFARYEKKYWLSPDQYHVLRGLLLDRMREDDYGRYTICNIYYDTPDYHLIRTSLEKPIYKEKLRLHSYGVPNAQSQVFLELKKKYRGVVYKRRAALAPDEAQAILSGAKRADGTQILREIAWALQFYQPEPKVYLAYDRIALYAPGEPGLRATFDTDLRWRGRALELEKGDWGAPLCGDGYVLMELKLPGVMPLWLARLLDSLAVYPVSFSKYGFCYRRYLSREAVWKGGLGCA